MYITPLRQKEHRTSSRIAMLLLPWRPLSRSLEVAYVSIRVDCLRCKEGGGSAAEDEHQPGFQSLYKVTPPRAQQVHTSLKLCVTMVFSHPCVVDVLQQQRVARALL